MKLLVIPDIHNNITHADNIIETEKNNYDKIIFLGDYFDNFGDTKHVVRRTAEWLKKSISFKDRVHILGNHDLPYMTQTIEDEKAKDDLFHTYCPGFTREKWQEIAKVLSIKDWEKIQLFHVEQFENGEYWLFSHAGLSRYYAGNNIDDPNLVLNKLRAATTKINYKQRHWIYSNYGKSQGGLISEGGLLWCRISDFVGIPCLNQVFGHTPLNHPIFIGYDKVNLCLDNIIGAYALIDTKNGEVDIKTDNRALVYPTKVENLDV